MSSERKRWTREELLVALNLYHKLTFGQLHFRNPAIIALAEKLGRSAGSLAMKLNNFASLDPVQQLRGIKGLRGTGALDRTVWNEFHENPAEAIAESEERLRILFEADAESEVEVIPKEGIRVMRMPTGPTTIVTGAKIRRGQSFFRNAVLNNFGGRCGITQLDIRELLIGIDRVDGFERFDSFDSLDSLDSFDHTHLATPSTPSTFASLACRRLSSSS
jgi:putative restriction endonuclease